MDRMLCGAPSRVNEFFQIPPDLVVAQEALAAESSLRLDFLLLHNFGASFDTP